MNRPLSITLTQLIYFAVVTLSKPNRYPGPNLTEAFSELAAEVRAADARPAENIRTTRAALIMVNALQEFYATGAEPGSPWLMLAGCTLPLLRVEAWVALNNEKQARGT